MNKWELIALGDCANINMGQSPDSVSYNDKGIGMPFLQGCADFGKKYPLTTTYTTNPNKTSVANAILISVRAPVGDLNIADKGYCIGRGLSSIIGKYGTANTDYLYYFLQYTKEVLKKSGQGSTFEAVNSKDLRNHKINLPPLPIQQKIAKILSTIDGQIEKTEAIIAKYQAVKQGMLQDLFTRGIDVANGELRPRYEDAPELYKDSPLGMIPKEWDFDVLDSQITAVDAQPDHRTPASVEGGIPYLGINDIDEFGDIDYGKCRKVSQQILKEQSNRYTLRNGDIIFGKIGTIGQPKRLKAWDNITISANVILIQPKENAAFIYWLLVSDLIRTQINNTIHTTSQPAFGMEKIRAVTIVIPPEKERMSISTMLDRQEKLISSEKLHLMKLNKIKRGLMSDLLSGKVDVTA